MQSRQFDQTLKNRNEGTSKKTNKSHSLAQGVDHFQPRSPACRQHRGETGRNETDAPGQQNFRWHQTNIGGIADIGIRRRRHGNAECGNNQGLFLNPNELKLKYQNFFSKISPENIIIHCGSGVTACHTILAIDYAGLPLPKLYVGSWSEWSRNNKKIVTEI